MGGDIVIIRVWTLKDSNFKHEGDFKTDDTAEILEKIAEKYRDSGKIFVLFNGTLQFYDGTWKSLEYGDVVAVALLDYAEHERYFSEEAQILADIMLKQKPF